MLGLAIADGAVEESRLWSTAKLAEALAAWRVRAAAEECRWLALLAEFDRREGWRADGRLSGVDWLVWRCGLATRTARDKLRVAHELRRRPLVAEAFASGSLSYCKVRAITRITDVDEECDHRLLALAREGTVAELDRVVRHWQHLRDQERGVDDYLRRWDRRWLRAHRTYDGMVVAELTLPLEEGEEVLRLLDAAVAASLVEEPVDGGSREPAISPRRRVDALLDLLRAGSAGGAGPGGADRYTLHLVSDVEALAGRLGLAETVDGWAVSIETLRRIACDCAVVRHLLRGASQPLDVGTRTPVWTVAQRRAITVRDGGRCRFPACERRTCDVHHVTHYADGGATAVNNGILICPRHHTAVHEGGFRITGDPNGTLTVHRPDGSTLGASRAGRPHLSPTAPARSVPEGTIGQASAAAVRPTAGCSASAPLWW
ncbi:MAG: HNH endonuclease [Actinomycetota bacterium]|nr:HNH endonuclease [Actinomycetota bacterium]